MEHGIETQFVKDLATEIAALPEDFFSTFRYTTTGNNLTHPVTLGAIVHVARRLPGVVHLGIDVRFNLGDGTKFQPDVVGFDEELGPCLIVDYESPNSSDAFTVTATCAISSRLWMRCPHMSHRSRRSRRIHDHGVRHPAKFNSGRDNPRFSAGPTTFS